MWADRLRQDFQLALVVTFGIVSNVMILPFAVYRFIDGQMLAGVVDTLNVACISFGALYAYRSGNAKHVALFLAITYSAGCIAIAYLAGSSGPPWMYAVILSNFLLIERKRAAVISAMGIAAVAASALALPDPAQKASFLSSSIVVCAFAYIFAWRTDLQRRQLEDLALLDPLTGASNRRGLNAELEIAMATSARNGKSLGLIIFDLDHFKRINDRHGHDAGDNVLVQVANAVRGTTRRYDRFFRLGGEEFALLIPDTSPDTLHEIAEKVRIAIQEQVCCGNLTVTISLGASILRSSETASDWRARADAAMYRAKHEGRNRTVIDELLVVDKPVRIRPAKTPKVRAETNKDADSDPDTDMGTDTESDAGKEKPTGTRKSVDARSGVESVHLLPPRIFGSRSSHKRQSIADCRLPVPLATLAANEPYLVP